MTNFDELPKSIKKTIRYIKYDASEKKLHEIEKAIKKAMEFRIKKKLQGE